MSTKMEKYKNRRRGNPQAIASPRGAMLHVMGLGQSPRDPQIRMRGEPRCHPLGSSHGSCSRDGADVSFTERPSLGLNLRRALRVGAWNVLTLLDDSRLPLLSAELARLRIEIAALSEVRRPGSGTISASGYNYYWSG